MLKSGHLCFHCLKMPPVPSTKLGNQSLQEKHWLISFPYKAFIYTMKHAHFAFNLIYGTAYLQESSFILRLADQLPKLVWFWIYFERTCIQCCLYPFCSIVNLLILRVRLLQTLLTLIICCSIFHCLQYSLSNNL